MDQKNDKQKFAILMGMLYEAFPTREPLSKTKVKLYYEFLKGYSIANVTYAIKECIKKFDYFPTIHQITEILGPYPDEPERLKIDMKFDPPKLLE